MPRLSPPSPTRSSRTRNAPGARDEVAFTLIELLTVIAVIGLLAAILLGAIQRVRTSAKETRCASNIRHFQLANMLYANNNKGKYVPAFTTDSEKKAENWYHNDEYRGLLDVDLNTGAAAVILPDHVKCPIAAENGVNVGYGYNVTGLGGSFKVANDERAVRINQIPRPNQTMAFIDGVDWQVMSIGADLYIGDEKASGAKSPAYRHDGSAHVAYWDGHVQKLSRETLVSDTSIWNLLQ